MTAFGALVADLREWRGMSLAELSEESGITAAELVEVEAGRRDATTMQVARIAKALRVNPAELVQAARGTYGK